MEEKKKIIGIAINVGQADRNGIMYTEKALRDLAAKNPDELLFKDGKLYATLK